jgi:uncharacterized nucleotidyltransferase DUF6036
MFQDFKDLLSALNAHGVKYLVVGGYAVSFHAQPRATKDLDLFIKADLPNARAAYAAIVEFGAPLQNIQAEELADPNGFIRLGQEPAGIDILPDIPGVEFDAAWDRRVEVTIDADRALKVFFISREDLVSSKLATGRPQDLADVEAIRIASESQGPKTPPDK